MVGQFPGPIVDQVSFEVERGKIREFARATRADDIVHVDPDAARARGVGDVPATPTHVAVAAHHRDQRGFVERLGLVLERVVVGSVRWEYVRPLVAGQTVTGSRRVVGDETRQGKRGGSMRLVTLETEYVDVNGVVLARQTEVVIERGATS